ncbi:hypothetical protein AB0F16_36915, partial [Streptomyces tanashiensis]|uniref:hypothetical protein n=1 Tax=Streptomyces tanashiensis TaxID=67367 RepID=UPI0033D8ECDB
MRKKMLSVTRVTTSSITTTAKSRRIMYASMRSAGRRPGNPIDCAAPCFGYSFRTEQDVWSMLV